MSSRSRSAMDSRCLMAISASSSGDRDLVHVVELLDADVDALLARRRQVLADVVGADRQLAVAAVGEHGELHARRAAVVEQGLDRRAHGAPGVQHVVHDHDGQPVDREVEVRGVDDRRRGPRAPSRRGRRRCRGRRAARPRPTSSPTSSRRRAASMRAAPVDADDGELLLGIASRRSRERSAPACGAHHRGRGRPSRFPIRAPSWPLGTGLKEPPRRRSSRLGRHRHGQRRTTLARAVALATASSQRTSAGSPRSGNGQLDRVEVVRDDRAGRTRRAPRRGSRGRRSASTGA